MASAVITVDTALRPQPRLHVRRRRVDGQTVLVSHGRFFIVDDRVDKIWRSCWEGGSIAEIAYSLHQQEPALSLGEATAATVLALQVLGNEGLLDTTAVDGERWRDEV